MRLTFGQFEYYAQVQQLQRAKTNGPQRLVNADHCALKSGCGTEK